MIGPYTYLYCGKTEASNRDPPLPPLAQMSRMLNALRTSEGFLSDDAMGEAVWYGRETWPATWRRLLIGYASRLRAMGYPVEKCRGHGWRWGQPSAPTGEMKPDMKIETTWGVIQDYHRRIAEQDARIADLLVERNILIERLDTQPPLESPDPMVPYRGGP